MQKIKMTTPGYAECYPGGMDMVMDAYDSDEEREYIMHIYTDASIYIYVYMYTRMRTHTCTHTHIRTYVRI